MTTLEILDAKARHPPAELTHWRDVKGPGGGILAFQLMAQPLVWTVDEATCSPTPLTRL